MVAGAFHNQSLIKVIDRCQLAVPPLPQTALVTDRRQLNLNCATLPAILCATMKCCHVTLETAKAVRCLAQSPLAHVNSILFVLWTFDFLI
jgi:hypothetical protein